MIIKKLRLDRGWSQEDLAETSGVSVRTIQRIENGGRASLETLKCLAAVFETPVPALRKAETMTDPDANKPEATAPVELQEPARPADGPAAPSEAPSEAPTDALSEEDRAALRYAKNLRRYDEERAAEAAQKASSGAADEDEARIRAEVRRMRGFYTQLIRYVVIVGFLLVINLLTSPGYIWAVWPALGLGIGLALHGWSVFGGDVLLGEDWERREVMKRLERLNRP